MARRRGPSTDTSHNDRFSIDINGLSITLIDHYRDGSVRQQFTVPNEEIVNLAQSLMGVHEHIAHHDHAHDPLGPPDPAGAEFPGDGQGPAR